LYWCLVEFKNFQMLNLSAAAGSRQQSIPTAGIGHQFQGQAPASSPPSPKRRVLACCALSMKGGDAQAALKNLHTTFLGVFETCGNMAQNFQDRLAISRRPFVPDNIILDGKVSERADEWCSFPGFACVYTGSVPDRSR